MKLEDEIRSIIAAGKGTIIVVDDGCDFSMPDWQKRRAYNEHVMNESECFAFAQRRGIELFLRDASHAEVQNGFSHTTAGEHLAANPGLVLVLANQGLGTQVMDLMQSKATVEAIRKISPESTVIHYVPNLESRSAESALRKVGDILLPGTGSEIESYDERTFPTLMHFLCFHLTGSMMGFDRRLSVAQHQYKNQMWEGYLPFIDESLRAGNLQTETDYHFLVLSDRERLKLGDYEASAQEKVKVKGLDYRLEDDDFSKCAAIFLDNSWTGPEDGTAIGGGIERLRQLRKELDEKGANIPIIYQTGNIEHLTETELLEIEMLGAVPAGKDIFPKICLSEELSEKELEMSRILQKNPHLAKYTAKIYDFGKSHNLGRGNLFVVCSRIVDGERAKDNEKEELFNELGVEDDIYNHRMYVLALMHEELKCQVENPRLKPNVDNFIGYSKLRDSLGERIEKYRSLYEKIANDPEHNKKTTVSHNDAKEDNWFKDCVLGDFTNASPGAEYKDTARSLLDEKDGFIIANNPEEVASRARNYRKIRQRKGKGFDEPEEDFVKRVQEAMFTESLRLAYFKKERNEGEGRVEAYLNVAETYFNLLSEAN